MSTNSINSKDRVPQVIALVFLFTFVATVIALFAINIYPVKCDDVDLKKGWFDLLKNALILLGTALTTVIGYYFGQREGAIATKQAIQESKNKEHEVVMLTKDLFENRNKEGKEGVSMGSDSPDQINPSADLDDTLTI